MSAEAEIERVDEEYKVDDEWQEYAVKIRASETEDGDVPVEITDWTVEGETAEVTYSVTGINKEFTETFNARINSGEKSEFEKFIESLNGYTVMDADLIPEERPQSTARVTYVNGDISASLTQPAEDTAPVQLETQWDEQPSTMEVLACVFIGVGPVVNWLTVLWLTREVHAGNATNLNLSLKSYSTVVVTTIVASIAMFALLLPF